MKKVHRFLVRLASDRPVGVFAVVSIAVLLCAAFLVTRWNAYRLEVDTKEENAALNTLGTMPLRDDDHVLGKRGAPVRVTFFFDSNCPYCKFFHLQRLPILLARHPAIEVVYRYYPIKYGYLTSWGDAHLLECSFRNGGDVAFWTDLETIYQGKPNDMPVSELASRLRPTASSAELLARCADDPEVHDRVNRDLLLGLHAAIGMVPTAVISHDGVSERIPGASLQVILRKLDPISRAGRQSPP